MIKALIVVLAILAGTNCLSSEALVLKDSQSSQTTSSGWQKISASRLLHAPTFYRVHFFNQLNGVAVASSTLFSTDDGGKDWRELSSFGDVFISSMFFQDDEVGWAVGNRLVKSGTGGTVIFRTADRGSTWTSFKFNLKKSSVNADRQDLNDVCVEKDNIVWIATDRGILESRIKSNTLEMVSVFRTKSAVNRFLCESPGNPIAVGRDGLFLVHDKNGWKAQKVGSNLQLTQIKRNRSSLWVVGHYSDEEHPIGRADGEGMLLESQDGGDTWTNRTPANASGLNDVAFFNNIGWLIGNAGQLYRTDDFGIDWVKQDIDLRNDLVAIFFLTEKLGWISGRNQTVLRFGE